MHNSKRIYSILLLFLFFNLNFHELRAQKKSDEIKYYILFDNSGSMKALDPHENLQKLLSEFVGANITGNKVGKVDNLIFSFDIRVFGEETSTQKEFKVSADKPSNLLSQINTFLSTEFQKTSKEKFTNINEALLDIYNSLEHQGYKNPEAQLPSTGLIIFTDGKFENGDYSNNGFYTDIDVYKSSFLTLLQAFEEVFKVPTFMVTTAGNPIKNNDFVPSPWNYADVLETDSVHFIRKDKEFWVNWQLRMEEDGSTALVLREFENFKFLANNKILSGINKRRKEIDEVDIAFMVEELLRLRENGQSLDFSSGSDFSTKVDTLFAYIAADKKEILKIYNQLSKIKVHGEKFQRILEDTRVKNLENIITSLKDKRSLPSDNLEEMNQFSLLAGLASEPIEAFEIVSKEVKKIDSDLESEIIVGFSDYLIERVKMEAVFAFFDNLKEDLAGLKIDKYFERTWSFLEDPANYTDFASLHKVMKSDLDKLPSNLISDKALVSKSSELVALFYLMKFTEEISKSGSLEQAFSKLKGHRLFDSISVGSDEDLQKALLMESYFLFISDMVGLLKDHDLISFYRQKNSVLEDSNEQALNSMLLAIGFYKDKNKEINLNLEKTQVAKLENLLLEFYEDYSRLKGELEFLISSTGKMPVSDYQEFRKYRASLIIDILKRTNELFLSAKELYQLISLGRVDDKTLVKTSNEDVFRRISDMIDFYYLIQKRDYEEAVVMLKPYLFSLLNDFGKNHFQLKKNLIRGRMYELELDPCSFESTFNNLWSLSLEQFETRREARNHIESKLHGSASGIKLINANWPSLFVRKKEISISSKWLDKRQKWMLGKSETLKVGWVDESWSNKEWNNIKKFVRSDYLKEQFISQSESINFTPAYEANFKKGIDKFVAIVSQTANARNSGEVQDIISRNALPVASYKLKRESEQSIMATAYVGVGLTYYHSDGEYLRASISAPVGFEYTFNSRLFNNYQSSISLMATIFDVGNVIDYRLKDDNEEEKFSLENIVSPGFIASVGFSHKLPLSLNVGYLFNPSRAIISLNFDLPLFHIWSKK